MEREEGETWTLGTHERDQRAEAWAWTHELLARRRGRRFVLEHGLDLPAAPGVVAEERLAGVGCMRGAGVEEEREEERVEMAREHRWLLESPQKALTQTIRGESEGGHK